MTLVFLHGYEESYIVRLTNVIRPARLIHMDSKQIVLGFRDSDGVVKQTIRVSVVEYVAGRGGYWIAKTRGGKVKMFPVFIWDAVRGES